MNGGWNLFKRNPNSYQPLAGPMNTLKQTEQVWTDLHNLLVEKGNKEEATRDHQFLDKFRLRTIQELQKSRPKPIMQTYFP